MSDQVTPYKILRFITNWKDLAKDTQWLLSKYIEARWQHTWWMFQGQGAAKANDNLARMLEDTIPGKNIIWCWYCGQLEFETSEKTAEKMGWIWNGSHVLYSGRLCPKCKEEPDVIALFNGNFALEIRHAAKIIATSICYRPELAEEIYEKIKAMLKTMPFFGQ